MSWTEGVLRRDRRSIARAISLVEEAGPGAWQAARELLSALYPYTGRAHVIGITGPPGTGKSTLINQMTRFYRRNDAIVAIIAVDPTSPFSGGALLGDRIRMRDAAADPQVFVRSMASRGAVGGLARTVADVIHILDAAGYTIILVETVGAGQDELTIAHIAHTTLVVESPGLGDDIQAIKAGLMEIADVLVVNKADRDGADQTARILEMMVESRGSRFHTDDGHGIMWSVPVCKTVALDGTGVPELISHIESHWVHLQQSGRRHEKEMERTRAEVEALLRQELLSRFMCRLEPGTFESTLSRVVSGDLAPYEALDELLNRS